MQDEELYIDPDSLYFVPLGGSEQFGVNLNVYAMNGSLLAIDCGIGFADHRFPMVDILLPDPSFIEERVDQLEALIITHAHEDHIGAVAHLWPRLRCPIYCTAFTAIILRAKLDDHGVSDVPINVIKGGNSAKIGPFKVTFESVAHSIPQAVACFIETRYGTVVHSGDWNLDQSPVLGQKTNEEAFRAVGDKGVLAYIGDSTNAPVAGRGKSEAQVEEGLAQLFQEIKGRIAITIFASNIARIRSIAKAAEATGRSVGVMGRSMHRMIGAARACGYLHDVQEFVQEEDFALIPHDQMVLIVTGSQGETQAALSRISRGEMRSVKLGRGDTVIFSARPIPGNEVEINNVINNLIGGGIRVITADSTPHVIHVSGHPYSEEIKDMLSWVRPQIVIPVHGERMQLEAQAEIARNMGVQDVIVPSNGALICLAPGEPEIVDHVSTGVLAVEPNRIVSSNHASIAQRRKLQFTGIVHVTAVIDKQRGELMADVEISTVGLIDHNNAQENELEEDLAIEIEDMIADMNKASLLNKDHLNEMIAQVVRRFVQSALRIKPKVTAHIIYS